MYHYGDKSMDFLDAVLILKSRGAVEEAEKHLAPDIALAIKTVEEGLGDEIKKAEDCGYTKGYLTAEKEKDVLVEKMSSALADKEEQMEKIKSLLSAHVDFSRETPEVNYELLVALFRILDLERDEERTNEIEHLDKEYQGVGILQGMGDVSPSKEYIEKLYSMVKMVDGCFTEERPEDSKTVVGWLKEGLIPVSADVVKTYRLSEDKGYQYVSKSDVREMTEEEKSAFEDVASERKKKSAETRKSKKEKDTGEKEPASKKQNTSNSKKIKHLPDYSAMQGKSILCIDTETTGIYQEKGDELLQVALVSLEDEKIQTLFQSLIKPHEKTSWVGAMIKNHISPRMVENAPYPEDIKNQVQEIVNQADVIVGYNIDFDINFLENCMGIDFSDKIIADPGDYFRKNQPNSSHFNLEACVANYCVLEDLNEYKAKAHKAETDAIATLKAFCAQSELEGYYLLSYEDKTDAEEEQELEL